MAQPNKGTRRQVITRLPIELASNCQYLWIGLGQAAVSRGGAMGC